MSDIAIEPVNAAKVLYRSISVNSTEGGESLEKKQLQTEELRLPSSLERMLFRALQSSNSQLPLSIRRFQDWDVALLQT